MHNLCFALYLASQIVSEPCFRSHVFTTVILQVNCHFCGISDTIDVAVENTRAKLSQYG